MNERYFIVECISHFKGADKELLEEVRRIVKALRTPSIKLLLHEKGLKEAILDVATRWNFLFEMVFPI